MAVVTQVPTEPAPRMNEEPFDPEWDAFLEGTPGGHYLQSSLWARIKSAAGWRAIRVAVVASDRIIGGAQILVRPLPIPALGNLGYVPKGPLVSTDDPSEVRRILGAIEMFVRRERIR